MFEKKNLEKWRLVEELHAPARKNFPLRCVIGFTDTMRLWQADVEEICPYTRFNKGYQYNLTVINVLSKYVGPYRSKQKMELRQLQRSQR